MKFMERLGFGLKKITDKISSPFDDGMIMGACLSFADSSANINNIVKKRFFTLQERVATRLILSDMFAPLFHYSFSASNIILPYIKSQWHFCDNVLTAAIEYDTILAKYEILVLYVKMKTTKN